MLCRLFSGISGLYLLDASGTLFPSKDNWMSFQALKISEVEVGRHNHFKLRTAGLEDSGATKRKKLGSEAYDREESCPID